jgi:hypothetical protein
MTNLTNFDRDMRWHSIPAGINAVSGNFASTLSVGLAADVYQEIGYFRSFTQTLAASAGDVSCVGVQMIDGTEDDTVPFRVKGSIVSSLAGVPCGWGVGYVTAPATVGGFHWISGGPDVDEVVAMTWSSANAGNPVCVFAMVFQDTACEYQASASVQRLIAGPPQYSSAVR